jgi:hypothetical protein|tara:strand:- start:490 stop:744 length:255 start_codon:yes stop_codon:yes gene_type:complete
MFTRIRNGKNGRFIGAINTAKLSVTIDGATWVVTEPTLTAIMHDGHLAYRLDGVTRNPSHHAASEAQRQINEALEAAVAYMPQL